MSRFIWGVPTALDFLSSIIPGIGIPGYKIEHAYGTFLFEPAHLKFTNFCSKELKIKFNF